MDKPLSMAYKEYLVALYDLTNKSGLPPFVACFAMEKTLAELRRIAELDSKREEAVYRQSLIDESGSEGT
jgi:hypothetical protein